MIDTKELRADKATLQQMTYSLKDRIEAAEKERVIDEQRIADLMADLNLVGHENEELRAKIEQMEKQEPVAYLYEYVSPMDGKTPVWLAGRGEWNGQQAKSAKPLYALPGAQPAPSVPDATWLPVPDKHPTFDPVDLQLADGSVLCGCVPQSDGDYWWKGPSGEVFIDPRYAPVTHWRLSAAPEAKR